MEGFLIYLIKSCGILALFWCCFKLFLQQETFFTFHRAFLISGIFMALFFPFWTLTQVLIVEPLPYSLMEPTTTGPVPMAAIVVNWWNIAGIIYLIGVFFFLGRFALQLGSLWRLLKRGTTTVGNDGFTYIETQEDTSPFSFFHIIVYNPTLHTTAELETILAHEKVHSLQKHSLDILLIHLFSTFQWINPFVWWYKATVSQNLEYIADQEVIKNMGSCREYQYLLLRNSAASMPHSSIINPIFNSSIKKRIVMLNKNRSHQFKAWKFSLVIPFLAFFLVAFNTKMVTQVNPPITSTGDPTKTEINEVAPWVTGQGLLEIHNNSIQDPLYIVDGVEYNGANTPDMDPSGIDSINVLKGPEAINKYGEKGKNGVIEITTKKNSDPNGPTENLPVKVANYNTDPNAKENNTPSITIKGFKASDAKLGDSINNAQPMITVEGFKASDAESAKSMHNAHPLIIINGTEMEANYRVDAISPDDIENVTVYRDENAIQKFGEKAKNGAVDITTKKSEWVVVGYGINTHSPNDLFTLEPFRQNGMEKAVIFLNGINMGADYVPTMKHSEIESVTTSLPSKSTTDKFGRQGKNGVIEITTKKD